MGSMKRIVSVALTLLVGAALAAACGGNGDEGETEAAAQQAQSLVQVAQQADDSAKEPIVFSDLNWPSAEIQNRIAGFIVEHGYGYETEFIPGETVSLWQGLLNNDTDITMEIWLPNHQAPYDKGIAEGTVIDAGHSLAANWQGFAIPQYIKDQNPGLVSVLDLPDYIELFATAESHGKARFIDCLAGWACAQNNEEKLTSYGLIDLMDLVDPGSTAAMIADLDAAFNTGEAWLGYIWGPSIPASRFDLYVLEEPAYSEECWAAGKSCAYPTAEIKIVVHKSLPERAPEIYDFLAAWDFSAESYLDTAGWMDANNETPDAAALWFLRNKRDVWKAFMPQTIAEKVETALAGADG